MNNARPIQTDDLQSEIAYTSLQNMIVRGVLPPGLMISESDLKARLGVGRTPVREALQRLQLEGFVEIHPRRGAVVTTVDIRQQLELIEVRRPLEDIMVRLAAARADKMQRDKMLEVARALEQAIADKNNDIYFELNRATHELEAQASKNAMLVRTIGHIHSLSRRFWYSFIVDADDFSIAALLHCQVLRCIAGGDADGAATAAAKLMDYLFSVTRRAIDSTFAQHK
jgi:DNA-binding GntR family transcriptional regulator